MDPSLTGRMKFSTFPIYTGGSELSKKNDKRKSYEKNDQESAVPLDYSLWSPLNLGRENLGHAAGMIPSNSEFSHEILVDDE